MKFKQYLAFLVDPNGLIPTPRLRWVIRRNKRPTAREEAIAAEVIRQANPRENITGHFSWGPEEQMVLQQLWVRDNGVGIWRDVPIKGAEKLFSTVETEHGDMPVPNAVKEPGVVQGDFRERLREVLGEEDQDTED
jgi:hypothetical protein